MTRKTEGVGGKDGRGLNSFRFFVCATVVAFVAFKLSLFVPHLPFYWSLGRALIRDCGIR